MELSHAEISASDTRFMPSFDEKDESVQNLKWDNTHTQHLNLTRLLISFQGRKISFKKFN
jgi:hypothetical protein